MNAIEECIEACNKLLRGELSAVESYTQAIKKFETEGERTALQGIRSGHEKAAASLRSHIQDMGGRPSESSGAWGGFVQALEGAALVLGESPALAVLEKGEQHGIDEYREALADEDVMEEIKQVIRGQLLPSCAHHLVTLGRLRKA
jgi:uncharacterized protein (TIGR02284 family)